MNPSRMIDTIAERHGLDLIVGNKYHRRAQSGV